MADFWDFFGGSGEEKNEKSSFENQSKGQKQTGSQKASGQSTSSQAEKSTEQRRTDTSQQILFTPEQEEILNSLLGRAAGRNNIFGGRTDAATQGQIDLSSLLSTRAAKTPEEIDSIVSSAQDAARLQFQETTAADNNRFAQGVGSKGNSAVQLLEQRGARELATRLAQVEGEIRLQGLTAQNQAGAVAADAASRAVEGAQNFDEGQSQALADAISVLQQARGSRATTVDDSILSGVSSEQVNQEQITQELLAELLQFQQEERGEGTSSSNQRNPFNVMDFLNLMSTDRSSPA